MLIFFRLTLLSSLLWVSLPATAGGFDKSQEMKKHPDMVFKHMEEIQECRTCHDTSRLNALILSDGTSIPYAEAPRLCGQCHGKIEFEWNRGLHGNQTGHWNGEKKRWSCSKCHEAHAPKFRAMQAIETPPLSKHIIRRGENHER